MSRFLKVLVIMLWSITLLQANEFDRDFNKEFQKMQSFFHKVLDSDLKKKYFNPPYPKVDMVETPSSYKVIFNLSGVEKKDIKLTLNRENILHIEGVKKQEKMQSSDVYIKQEIFFGKFQRSIELPRNINETTLKTHYDNGILTVQINKKIVTSTKSKVIPIN